MKIFYRREMVANAGSYSLSPLKPKAFVDRLDEMRFAEVASFEPATRDQLKLAHDPAYVDGVLEGDEANGFGNKSRSVAASLPFTVGSMIAAAREATDIPLRRGGRPLACSPTSGFHHAGYSRGGGFCTFNGLVIAAMVARQEKRCDMVYIFDGDQHWGNGTQDIIKRLKLTWLKQFHGPRTNAKDYFKALDKAHEEAMDADLVFYQAGADIHVDDPLGGILTSCQMRERDEVLRYFAMSRPFVWNLAGGYQLDPKGKTPEEKLAPVVDLHIQTQRQLCSVDGDVDLSDPEMD
jgi:acetoin utilization deacetylase AcuC-like enzyme